MQSMSYSPSGHKHCASFSQPGPSNYSVELPVSSSFYPMFTPTNGAVNGSQQQVNDFQQEVNDYHHQQHNIASRAGFASTHVPRHDATKQQNCPFLTRSVDDCAKSRFYVSALEYYLLEEPAPATPQGVCCMMSDCPRIFRNAKQMLWHLRECTFFRDGKFDCPECNTTEKFSTTSSKKCSWFRSRLSSKAMQFLHASAEVMKRMIGPKSSLCTNCKHTLKEDLENTIRGRHGGSSTKGLEDLPPSYPDHGKRPSTGSSSSPSEDSGPELFELFDSTLHELHWQTIPNELVGDDPLQTQSHQSQIKSQSQWGLKATDPSPVESLSEGLNASQSTPPTEVVSCLSARSMEGFTPDVSPTSSGRSPNTLDGTMSAQYTGHNALFQMDSHLSTANTQQPSVHLTGHTYGQTLHLTSSTIDIQDLPEGDILLQESFQGKSHINGTGNENSHVRQPTPNLSVNIPPVADQCNKTPMTWGPDFSFTFDPILDLPNDATATGAPTPTVCDFNKAMLRSRTKSFPRAAATASASTAAQYHNQFRGQQKKCSFSSTDDLSPDSAISSSVSAGETDSVSPGSGKSGKSMPSLELQCPECGFIPTGKSEKLLAYSQKHKATHRGNRWSCQHCNKTYSRKDNAASHAKKIHGNGSHVFGTPCPSPATAVGNNFRKRNGSGYSDSMNSQQQRKKSRSNSNESATRLVSRGEWGGTI